MSTKLKQELPSPVVAKGGRKVLLTKWMLSIFSVGTIGYMILSGYQGQPLPDSFYMNFVMGLGFIGGAFTAGNIFEHRAKAEVDKAKAENAPEAEYADNTMNSIHTPAPANPAKPPAFG